MATLKEREKRAIAAALALAQQAGQFPASKLWIDYDDEADVLSISLKRPKQATQTVEVEDQGILLRYRGKELVGITVLDASQRRKKGGIKSAWKSIPTHFAGAEIPLHLPISPAMPEGASRNPWSGCTSFGLDGPSSRKTCRFPAASNKVVFPTAKSRP